MSQNNYYNYPETDERKFEKRRRKKRRLKNKNGIQK